MIVALNIKQMVRDWLEQKCPQCAFRQAVNRAYATFAQKYPQWATSYFDQHFLTHAATPLLVRVGQGVASVQGYALAVVWSRQMSWPNEKIRQQLVGELTPVATEFLFLLEIELRDQATIGEWIPQTV